MITFFPVAKWDFKVLAPLKIRIRGAIKTRRYFHTHLVSEYFAILAKIKDALYQREQERGSYF